MSVITCRECHREDRHTLSCSHVRYEGRTDVQPSDEVAVPHEPAQPYCPGPNIGCYYGDSGVPDLCSYSDGPCYYGTETMEQWEATHGPAVDWAESHRFADITKDIRHE